MEHSEDVTVSLIVKENAPVGGQAAAQPVMSLPSPRTRNSCQWLNTFTQRETLDNNRDTSALIAAAFSKSPFACVRSYSLKALARS
jgi:hypothetical protein